MTTLICWQLYQRMGMDGHTTYLNYTAVRSDLVEKVTVRATTNVERYPSGWDYAYHLGTLGGTTFVRYDNAHEPSRGHDYHTTSEVNRVDFSGPWVLLARFYAETLPYWNAVGYDPTDHRPL